MSDKFCKACEKKQGCVKICKDLESYLKKGIEINNPELLISNDYIDEEFDQSYSLKNLLHAPRDEVIIKMYFIERVKKAQIAKKLRCSPSIVTRCVQKYERILNPQKA